MKCGLILFLLFVSMNITTKAEAFFEIFTVYGTHNRTINSIIFEALKKKTPQKEWIRTRVPLDGEYESYSCYIPESGNYKNPITFFYFTEINYTNHPDFRGYFLDDFLLKIVNEKKRELSENRSKCIDVYTDKNGIKKEIEHFATVQLISRTGDTISFEDFRTKRDLLSEEKQVELDSEHYQSHSLRWIVDLGKNKFREYKYIVKERAPLTVAEKANILELFKYMEEKIKHVE